MSEIGIEDVERIIANTINETARGDPDALAASRAPASPRRMLFMPLA